MRPSSQPAGYSKKKARQGYATVEAIDPTDGDLWDLLISNDRMDWIASQGMGAAKQLAITVRQALLSPRAIFEGVRSLREDIDGDQWLCYVATPARAFDLKTGAELPAWPGEVFLVFVTDERIVYLWNWEACDPLKKQLPVGYETRFKTQLF